MHFNHSPEKIAHAFRLLAAISLIISLVYMFIWFQKRSIIRK